MQSKVKRPLSLVILTALTLLTGCNGSSANPNDLFTGGTYPNVDPGVRRDQASYSTDVSIYDGTGTAHTDTASVESILDSAGITYRTVDSDEMNALTDEDLKSFGMIIWPGGKAKAMSNSLTPETHERIRHAVANEGIGYLGFCAGAFITGTYTWNPTWGLAYSPIDFPYYSAHDRGISEAMTMVTLADGTTRDLVYIGGPQLNGFGETVAKYRDGTAAIAQSWIGNGLVVITGPHPEAPNSWREAYGLDDTDGDDFEFTLELVRSVLNQQKLPAHSS